MALSSSPISPISQVSILVLLDWWQQRKRCLSEIEAAAEIAEEEKRQEREKVAQELSELRGANTWRLQMLTAIAPAEEAVVAQHLSDIERTLMGVQRA